MRLKKQTLVVLGGGLSGLAAAEMLSPYFKVIVLEQAPFLGGLASNFEHHGQYIPRYYHHIIRSNKTTLKYLWEFGKVRELCWKKIKLAIGIDGKLYNINQVAGLLKFDHLNIYERMRFGLFGLYTLFLMNPKNIKEDLDAERWLNRYAGRGVTRKIFYHLYSRNKFNIPLRRISAKQFAHRLYEKEIYDYFSFPKSGYQEMISALEKKIQQNGGIIKKNSKVNRIKLKQKYILESSRKIKYGYLLSSIPFPEFLNLSDGLPEPYRQQLLRIKYCPAVGICFSTEKFLDQRNY